MRVEDEIEWHPSGISYDIRPRVIARQADSEELPIVYGVEPAELTDAQVYDAGIYGHLKHFDNMRNGAPGLAKIVDNFEQMRLAREQIHQRHAFPSLENSSIPEVLPPLSDR